MSRPSASGPFIVGSWEGLCGGVERHGWCRCLDKGCSAHMCGQGCDRSGDGGGRVGRVLLCPGIGQGLLLVIRELFGEWSRLKNGIQRFTIVLGKLLF